MSRACTTEGEFPRYTAMAVRPSPLLLIVLLVAGTPVVPLGAQTRHGVAYARRFFRFGRRTVCAHVCTVDLCDASVAVRTTAPSEGGRTVRSWARRVGAEVAVNGDYFDGRSLRPLGPSRGNGAWWAATLREHRDALLGFSADGDVHVLDAPAGASEALWPGIENDARVATWTQLLAVRERILVQGVARRSPRVPATEGRHPRTAVGLSRDRHTMAFVVVDGRGESGDGATVSELASILGSVGMTEGMKLDGGGSSTMYVRGHGIVNRPSDGHERRVANHIGVVLQAASGVRPRCASGSE